MPIHLVIAGVLGWMGVLVIVGMAVGTLLRRVSGSAAGLDHLLSVPLPMTSYQNAGIDNTEIGAAATEVPAPSESKPPASDPILVVEDDAATRRLIATALSLADLEVVEASTAEHALSLLGMGCYRAVVLDNHLPGMSGIQLVGMLRDNPETATLPILLVSGDNLARDRVGGLRTGANDYITKPFDLDELVARVQAQLRQQETWTTLLDANCRQRRALATALGQMPSTASAEDTAGLMCAELARLGHEGVAILAVVGSSLVPWGLSGNLGWRLPTGRPLRSSLSSYLLEKSGHGPWLEHLADDELATLPQGPTPTNRILAFSPIVVANELVGLLILCCGDDSPLRRTASRALSDAIDYADVAAGLLRPTLDLRRVETSRRSAITAILEDHAFSPVFQPIVRLPDREVVGYEALTRFADGCPPEVRFTEAGAVGLGVDLEMAAIDAALDSAARLAPGRFVSLNVSPGTAASEHLPARLAATGRPAVLELTEHDQVEDYDALRTALAQLPGTDLSIDDAGAGFATLRHVIELRPQYLKLDRSWVTGIDSDATRQALVEGISYFGDTTGCIVVAEGVETEAEAEMVARLGVPLAQGFLFGQPATP